MNDSMTVAGPNFSDFSVFSHLVTPTARITPRGMPKKSSVRFMTTPIPNWRNEITAWHRAHLTNGPTEAANNLIKRVKRVAFGFTLFRNYRIRSLRYAGRPDRKLLTAITPNSP